MDRYDVELQDEFGRTLLTDKGITEPTLDHVVAHAQMSLGVSSPGTRCSFAVYRRRRLRGRTLVAVVPVGGSDGSAGVREPRRPQPGPGSLTAARELPGADSGPE